MAGGHVVGRAGVYEPIAALRVPWSAFVYLVFNFCLFHLFFLFAEVTAGWRISRNVLGSLEVDVHVLAGVEEQMLVVGGLLDHVGAQRVARLPVVEVIELPQPRAKSGGLAVGAGARDLVADDGGRHGGHEDVEGGLSVSACPMSASSPHLRSSICCAFRGALDMFETPTPNGSSTLGAS